MEVIIYIDAFARVTEPIIKRFSGGIKQMKRHLCLIMALMLIIGCAPAIAGEVNPEDSGGNPFSDTWNAISDAATETWNNVSEATTNAVESAGNAINQAWNDASNAVVNAWNQVGTYFGAKHNEFQVWMMINDSDALIKLKAIYDENAEEMQIEPAAANELWLKSMDYAQAHGIAKVTQAKLTLYALLQAQQNAAGGDIAQTALDFIMNSGITNQAAAENELSRAIAANSEVPCEPDPNEPRYYMGEAVNTGQDNGYSGAHNIGSNDPHFGWTLGRFFVSGYTSVQQDEDGNPIFIKTLGDRLELWFQLEQDIDCLNGNDALLIAEDENGFDEKFGISRTNFGRGAMVIQHTDYRNASGMPQLYTDYLSGITASGADTTVQLLEEGDYEVALNYEVKNESNKLVDSYSNYRITFKFSVRNGNCMVYPFDAATGAELTNTAITPNGFYLDLARSRYLDINIKREVLAEGALGLTEDVRFNRPARDGDMYTEEGIYTITVKNSYTGQETTKQIYVGTDKVVMAHMTTGLSIEEVRAQLSKGAKVADDGTIIGMITD